MRMRRSKATKPMTMPAPLASERSRCCRGLPDGCRDAGGLPGTYLVRRQNLPRLAVGPELGVTGLRSFLARAACRQFMTRRRRRFAAARDARSARSAADGSRNLAVPALPEVRSRNWRSKSSGPGTAPPCSVDM